MITIDWNADLGEGAGHDARIMALIRSANIGCGVHAGDESTSREAIRLAITFQVRIGAHPGYADREHFGRRELAMSPEATRDLCLKQVQSLINWAHELGGRVEYIKPHGGLYHQTMREGPIAEAIIDVAAATNLALMGLPRTVCERLCEERGVAFIREGFADRRYRPDGMLVPRSEPDAMIQNPEEAAAQVRKIMREWGVQSICIHGDTPDAIGLIQRCQEIIAGTPV